ncbi:SDR family oxidoreductase [Amycolatopsis sp. NPDC051903]|uniref:SDR family oxidoreductase n=1 Tax=Amycolatopsis sp. NPDC051903 TaxID=3363936 RepID=UPI0037A690E1
MGEAGTRVLVTGAAGGIGAAIAESFATAGAAVTGLDRERGPDQRITSVTGDVREPDAVRRAVATAAPQGRLDVLVLAAGVHDGGAGLDTELADLAQLLDAVTSINVKGYVLTLAAAAPALRAAAGCVVFVLSDASFLSGGNGAGIAYTASKHADLGVLKWAARALAPDVRVNGVAPGGVRTGLRVEHGQALWDDDSAATREDRIRGGNPLGVLLTPGQVAHYVRLLADPAAGALTGEILRLDGGRSLVAG